MMCKNCLRYEHCIQHCRCNICFKKLINYKIKTNDFYTGRYYNFKNKQEAIVGKEYIKNKLNKRIDTRYINDTQIDSDNDTDTENNWLDYEGFDNS